MTLGSICALVSGLYLLAGTGLSPARLLAVRPTLSHFLAQVYAKWLGAAGLLAALAAIAPAADAPLALGLPASAAMLPWLACTLLVPAVVYVASRRSTDAPQLVPDAPTLPRYLVAAGAWAAWLLAYELLFRGPLTVVAVRDLGLVDGLLVMTGLYTLAHCHKPLPEALSCLLIGPVFGWLAIVGESIWLPWSLHLAIALAGEAAGYQRLNTAEAATALS